MLLALGLRTPGRPRRRCRDGRDRRALARVLMPNLRLAPRPRPTTPVASIHATASPRRIGATASGGRGSVKAAVARTPLLHAREAVALGRSRWKASDRSRETCTPGATGISGVTSPSLPCAEGASQRSPAIGSERRRCRRMRFPRKAGRRPSGPGGASRHEEQVRFCGRPRAWQNGRLHDRRAGYIDSSCRLA